MTTMITELYKALKKAGASEDAATAAAQRDQRELGLAVEIDCPMCQGSCRLNVI